MDKKIWDLRGGGGNYQDPEIEYPEIVHLDDASDFNSIIHKNVLISFAVGGYMADSMRDIQYYHNSSVMAEYHRKKNPKPPLILYHHVVIPKKSKLIEIHIDNICLDRNIANMLNLRNEIIDMITPPINKTVGDEYVLYFINTYGINSYEYEYKIKCLCDNNNVNIHFLEKPINIPHIDGYDKSVLDNHDAKIIQNVFKILS